MTTILGISAYYHDSAACLVIDGDIVAAAQEERFTRKKHDQAFPSNAIAFCLQNAGLTPDQLDLVGFYDKPLVKFDRLLETYLDYAPVGLPSFLQSMPLWIKEKLWLPDLIRRNFAEMEGVKTSKEIRQHVKKYSWQLCFGDHHESHAASAFYPSPFEEAAIVTIDGVGEWATCSVGSGSGHEFNLLHELRFPHSLGLLYSAFTYFTGFKVNSGEYKIMGLAPYGQPTYSTLIKDKLLDIKEDGSVRLNQEYFTYCEGLHMTGNAFENLFGSPARKPESLITQRDMDLARSIQDVTEEILLKIARFAHRETGATNLCMAGGVALNCVANGRIAREGPFKQVWIQPAAGDAGGALGVALALWHRYLGKPRRSAKGKETRLPYPDAMKGSLLGPCYSNEQVRNYLDSHDIPYQSLDCDSLPDVVASLLTAEKIVGLHQGRMEFGPRALGARSILGDPRSPRMQSIMNLKIKYREGFRPFAPSVMREHVSKWFEFDGDSPYMLFVANVLPNRRRVMTAEEQGLWGIDKLNVPRSEIPAVTHIDYSARIQTVHKEVSPLYWSIIEAFYRQTNCPLIVNTSFNVRGEPIVCTPEDAYRCFMRTEMDALVIGDCLLNKTEQPDFNEERSWQHEFPPD